MSEEDEKKESAEADGQATAPLTHEGEGAPRKDQPRQDASSAGTPDSPAPASAGASKPRPAVGGRVKALIAALAVALIAICGWSAVQYGQGRDPLAALFGDQALVTTDEAGSQDGQDPQAAQSVDAQDGQDAGAADPDEASQQDAEQDQGTSPDAGTQDDASADASDASGSGTSKDGSAQADAPAQQPSGASPSQTGTSASQPVQPAPSASSGASQQQSQDIRISVTIDGTAAGGSSRSYAVTIAPGSNAYDALVATGIPLNAEDTVYGTYVASIDGLAEKDHGSMSGWVYAVNGVEPNTAASNYQLEDGDAVVWTYVNVDY